MTDPRLIKQLKYNRGPKFYTDEHFEYEVKRRNWESAKRAIADLPEGKGYFRGVDIRLFNREEISKIFSSLLKDRTSIHGM